MTPLQRDAFLKVLARTGKVEHAAQRAGIPRSTIYRHRNTDAEFARQWDDAVGKRSATPQQFPPRIEVELLTPEQRRLARQFLASLEAVPPGTAPTLARAALDRWLSGEAWAQLDDAVAHELRLLSSRAHADYLASRAIVAPPADDLPSVLGEDITQAR